MFSLWLYRLFSTTSIKPFFISSGNALLHTTKARAHGMKPLENGIGLFTVFHRFTGVFMLFGIQPHP